MESFEGRVAVVTGGGTGMGRELVVQLAAQGCSVAMCDVQPEPMAETARRAHEAAEAAGHEVRITTHICDVADGGQVERFAAEVAEQHRTDAVNLVFNNAGIGGGGSFVTGDRDEWERTFDVCWGGVYNGSRAFLPMLLRSDEGHLVNTSSVNGLWASLGPGVAHTAYPAAKFAVRGFSEGLIEDLRLNAPHVKVSVVMPGHIGTDIVINSRRILGGSAPDEMTPEDIAETRRNMAQRGLATDGVSDADIKKLVEMMGEGFRDNAPTSAAEAATIILDGVKAGEWRILVGEDAKLLDEAVRRDPVGAYGEQGLQLGGLFNGADVGVEV